MKLLTVVEYTLGFAGVCASGYWSHEVWVARAYQVTEGRKFSSARLAEGGGTQANTAAPSPVELESHNWTEGSVIGRLTIPRLGLSSIILEGVADRELKLAAGHIPGTALPGGNGNAAIAGHRDTVFRPLRLIRRNDAIKLATLNGEYEYRVVSAQIVEPTDVQVLSPTKTETLTLITCYPFYFVGPAPKRFIIKAERIPPSPTT